jgi:hypothetical protein
MRSTGMWQRYINITIIILDIIHRPAFYLKHDRSETGFCLRFQVKPLQFFGDRDYEKLYLMGPTI